MNFYYIVYKNSYREKTCVMIIARVHAEDMPNNILMRQRKHTDTDANARVIDMEFTNTDELSFEHILC